MHYRWRWFNWLPFNVAWGSAVVQTRPSKHLIPYPGVHGPSPWRQAALPGICYDSWLSTGMHLLHLILGGSGARRRAWRHNCSGSLACRTVCCMHVLQCVCVCVEGRSTACWLNTSLAQHHPRNHGLHAMPQHSRAGRRTAPHASQLFMLHIKRNWSSVQFHANGNRSVREKMCKTIWK